MGVWMSSFPLSMNGHNVWACGTGVCKCMYCMGLSPSGLYFCRPGCYKDPEGGAHNHDNELAFNNLADLATHRMLHALDGAHLEGSLDKVRRPG